MMNEYTSLLMHAYPEELEASSFYTCLANAASTPVCRALLASAANDEYRHAQMLAALLSGVQPRSMTTLETAKVRPADLEKAIQGELEAICDYARLAALAPTVELRLLFLSILGDEYGHVRMFHAMEAAGCA